MNLSNIIVSGKVVAGIDGVPDPYFANVSLLMHADSLPITDFSSVAHTLTANGDATVSTSIKQFGAGSLQLDGVGDYYSFPTSASMSFGTGDFTVETWVRYATQVNSDNFFVTAVGTGGLFFGEQGAQLGFGRVGVAWDYLANHGMTANNWYHLALCRSGTTIRMFVNGTLIGSPQTNSTSYNMGASGTTIGWQSPTLGYTGYIDDMRVTKGVARYTANFSVPTAAFPNF